MRIRTLLVILLAGACSTPDTPVDSVAEVRALLDSLSTDLAERGPVAWLDHFDHGPDFYMANDGLVMFASWPAADSVIRGFAPEIAAMQLEWLDARLDALAPDVVAIGSSYRESMTDTSGSTIRFGGYVTATAVRIGDRWTLRNLHWSSPPPSPE